jgi:hypothetical protein
MIRAEKWRIGSLFALIAAGLALADCVYVRGRVYRDLPSPILAPLKPLPEIATLSSKQCRSCHPVIYAEWSQSAHGRAVTDALYQADLKAQGSPYFCDYCHAPLVEQRRFLINGLEAVSPGLEPIKVENPGFVSELYEEGIMCVACHQQDGAMIGPIETASAAHPTRKSTRLREPEFCAKCHQLDFRFVGNLQRPISDTLLEWRLYRKKGGEKVCVDCHMPTTEKRRAALGAKERIGTDHSLKGPFDREFVLSGLEIKTSWPQTSRKKELRAVLQLSNRTGHRFPTSEPHRRVDIFLDVLDEKGRILQQTRRHIARQMDIHNLEESPDEDNTLLPLQTRDISLVVPSITATAAHVARVRIEFVLWDPEDPVAKAAGLSRSQLVHQLYADEVAITP